jgi:hypothetical protein
MAELAEQRRPPRKVPRLLNLVVRTLAAFLGGCAALTAAIFVVSGLGAGNDGVTVAAVMCAFVAGASLAFIGVGRWLGPLDPSDARESLSQAAGPLFEAALAALNRPAAAPRGAHFWPLLLGSLAIFVAAGGISTGVTGLGVLSAVLMFHEAGHLIAMRAFAQARRQPPHARQCQRRRHASDPRTSRAAHSVTARHCANPERLRDAVCALRHRLAPPALRALVTPALSERSSVA